MDDVERNIYKEGETFRADIPFSLDTMKVHVMYVLDGFYKDEKLIVYRVYGKHKQYWHQFMCNSRQMDYYRHYAKRLL